MYIMYVDESGDSGLPRANKKGKGTNFFVLAGLIVAYRDIQVIARALDATWRPYLRSARAGRGELKRRLLFKGDVPFNHMTEVERQKLDDATFSVLCNPPGNVTLLAVIVDKSKHTERYRAPRRPDLLAFEFLTERFSLFLNRNNAYGLVIHDSRGKEGDKELKAQFSGWVSSGTSQGIKMDRIIETVLFAPSEDSRLLQAADFYAHALLSHYERRRWQDRFPSFQHLLDKDPKSGNVDGWGLKCWPE